MQAIDVLQAIDRRSSANDNTGTDGDSARAGAGDIGSVDHTLTRLADDLKDKLENLPSFKTRGPADPQVATQNLIRQNLTQIAAAVEGQPVVRTDNNGAGAGGAVAAAATMNTIATTTTPSKRANQVLAEAEALQAKSDAVMAEAALANAATRRANVEGQKLADAARLKLEQGESERKRQADEERIKSTAQELQFKKAKLDSDNAELAAAREERAASAKAESEERSAARQDRKTMMEAEMSERKSSREERSEDRKAQQAFFAQQQADTREFMLSLVKIMKGGSGQGE